MTEQPQKKKGILDRLFPNFMRDVRKQHEIKKQQKLGDLETNSEKICHCPSCGQECTKEEYESGFCLDCDTVEMGL
jgi:hypothetical protein